MSPAGCRSGAPVEGPWASPRMGAPGGLEKAVRIRAGRRNAARPEAGTVKRT